MLLCRALLGKKTAQQLATFFQPHAGRDLALVIERRKLQQIQRAARRAALRIARAKHHAREARVHDGARAHRTRLLRDVKRAIGQPPVAHGILRLRKHEHFRVRGGVLERLDLIKRARNNSSFAHDDRANRHFAAFVSLRRLPQRFAHEIIVAVQINDGIAHFVNCRRRREESLIK